MIFGSRFQESNTHTERILLALSGIFILIGYISLSIQRTADTTHWATLAVWAISAISGHAILNRYLPNRDRLLFPLVMFLSGWGLLIIDRLAAPFADRQTIWLPVACMAMLAVAILPGTLRWLRAYRYTFLLIGLVLLISTMVLGRNPTGDPTAPQLWLGIGSIYFQPSEALKIVLVVFLASYLGEQFPLLRRTYLNTPGHRIWLSPQIMGPIVLMWGLSVVVTIWQRDLGTAILFFVVFLILLYVTSGYKRILISGALLIAIGAIVAYNLFDVVQLRVDIWLNPWPEADGRAYQIVQSLMAFAAGGIFGQGVGQGAPLYIPVVHSDFVFAAISEEWGLLGIIVIISCFAIIVARGIYIATLQQERPFYALLATGLTLLIGIQSLLIMGGVLKIVPLTGVTLPFLSYGGSSLLASYVIIGLLLRLSSGDE